jgi:hypothetical protein
MAHLATRLVRPQLFRSRRGSRFCAAVSIQNRIAANGRVVVLNRCRDSGFLYCRSWAFSCRYSYAACSCTTSLYCNRVKDGTRRIHCDFSFSFFLAQWSAVASPVVSSSHVLVCACSSCMSTASYSIGGIIDNSCRLMERPSPPIIL